MRRWIALIVVTAASGCSTAPLAGFLDLVHPSHVGPAEKNDDPLHDAFPPAPPSGAQPPPLPPAPPPSAIDSGFAPPERSPSRTVPPLTLPNT